MIIDLRYHVVSLVAVFLALGLGIIIGINFGKTDDLQLDNQIERLEQTYQKIRDDQKTLQANLQTKENMLESAQQFQRAIMPNLTLNRLLGKRIAVIRTNDSVDFKHTKAMVDLLKQAGAEVTSVTTFLKPLDLTDAQFRNEVIDAFGLVNVEEKNLMAEISRKIIQTIINGQSGTELLFLQNREQVKLWGDYNRGYVDTIVFFGGGNTAESAKQQEIDQPLVEAVRKTEITVVGVEPSFVTHSYMRLYQSKIKGTIDNIDTPPGEMTLVYMLASGKKGHFGTKETARRLIPEFKLNY
ncbi:MAG TPA: copper transporter [Bacillota bacterium]|nr:copper transporter [Bacillota bacterium]